MHITRQRVFARVTAKNGEVESNACDAVERFVAFQRAPKRRLANVSDIEHVSDINNFRISFVGIAVALATERDESYQYTT